MRGAPRIILAIAVALGVTTGCVERYRVSVPTNADVTKYRHWGLRATVQHQGVTAGILPHNRRALAFLVPLPIPIPDTPGSPFGISLALESPRSELLFDPRQVTLQIDGHRALEPSGVEAHCSNPETRLPRLAFCAQSPEEASSPAEPIPIPGYCCLGLWFDVVPPKPGTVFELSLGSVQRDSELVELGSVRFGKQRVGWERGRELEL